MSNIITSKQQEFIDLVYKVLKETAPAYSIKAYPAIIAQAILESGWGESTLAKQYHNYFGLKCGSSWRGRAVNLNTKEEINGKNNNVSALFRVYDSMENGIIGYLDFINTKRYANLKGVKNSYEYLTLIKQDGYATSSAYVKSLIGIINRYNLERYAYTLSTKSYNQIALECIRGKYGNGAERKSKIEALGYDYSRVQSIVNQMLEV